jgi:hypothetical protein
MSHAQPAQIDSPSPEALERARLQRTVWVSLAITAIWAAVVAVAALGGDIVVDGGASGAGGTTSVPSGVPIAILACIATFLVARYGFPDDHHRGSSQHPR